MEKREKKTDRKSIRQTGWPVWPFTRALTLSADHAWCVFTSATFVVYGTVQICETYLNVFTGGSVTLQEVVCCHDLGLDVLLERRVTPNLPKVVLNDHLYYVIKHFRPDGSGSLPAWQCSLPQESGARRLALRVWTWRKSYGMAFTLTRRRPNWRPLWDFIVMCQTVISSTISSSRDFQRCTEVRQQINRQ